MNKDSLQKILDIVKAFDLLKVEVSRGVDISGRCICVTIPCVYLKTGATSSEVIYGYGKDIYDACENYLKKVMGKTLVSGEKVIVFL